MLLGEAVRTVFEKYPDLADYAVVEHFPPKIIMGRKEPQGVFSYHFMGASGRNIATYIPDMEAVTECGGLIFHTDLDERGREYCVGSNDMLENISVFKVPMENRATKRPGL